MIEKKLIKEVEKILLDNDILTINDYINFIIALILDNFTVNDTLKLIDKLEHTEIKNWMK